MWGWKPVEMRAGSSDCWGTKLRVVDRGRHRDRQEARTQAEDRSPGCDWRGYRRTVNLRNGRQLKAKHLAQIEKHSYSEVGYLIRHQDPDHNLATNPEIAPLMVVINQIKDSRNTTAPKGWCLRAPSIKSGRCGLGSRHQIAPRNHWPVFAALAVAVGSAIAS